MSDTQIVQMPEEETPLTSYSIDELNQLNKLLIESLNHYNGLFKDEKLMATIKDGDVMALKLCIKETEAEMKLVADEIASRSNKK
jgi:hypothetical protein